MPTCPICGQPAAPRSQNKALPFCSARCKQIDLGQWLDEKYRVTVPDTSEAIADSPDAVEYSHEEKP
jgi:endogenous inhibitor of DNA gyrase (YacG/DUF329 family)